MIIKKYIVSINNMIFNIIEYINKKYGYNLSHNYNLVFTFILY